MRQECPFPQVGVAFAKGIVAFISRYSNKITLGVILLTN
ncbi:hypothetical protein EPYR_00684 [Erwinia pyrifoliae DSM 12163]|nr:hypothetical protein EPYR_00684 [Erwinia pyrifoliae DSM 12163]